MPESSFTNPKENQLSLVTDRHVTKYSVPRTESEHGTRRNEY